MEIKRYKMDWGRESTDGEWVRFEDVEQLIKNEQKRLELLNETKLKLKLSRNKGWTKSETILLNIIHALEMLEGVEVSDEG